MREQITIVLNVGKMVNLKIWMFSFCTCTIQVLRPKKTTCVSDDSWKKTVGGSGCIFYQDYADKHLHINYLLGYD